MNCDGTRELLEAHALGALEVKESRQVEAHLAACGACRALFDAYVQAVNYMPDALPGAPPAPAALKQRLMDQVTPPPGHRLRRASIRPKSSIRWARPSILRAAAAGLVLLLVGLSLAWGLQQRSALAREKSLRAELEAMVGQQEVVLEVVDSNRTLKAQLRATEPGSTAYGKLYTRPDMPWVVALAGRLPPKSDEEVYNLWLTRDGREELAGPLEVNESGFALILFDAGVNGPIYESARVVRQLPGIEAAAGSTVVRWEATR
jgi:anti-sigma-K factor RskA